MIKLDDVHFAYGQAKPIVQGVSLSVTRGQVVAVMGPSGCGKTTLLRLVAGLLRPSEGQATLLGAPLPYDNAQALREVRKKMGMLFQFGALFTDMSVFENVAFPLRENTKMGFEEIRAQVMSKLTAVDLADAEGKMPSEISGGMARRVALARAIAQNPQIMLFDEPFTGLDPIAMDTIAQLIRQQTNELNAASIVVSHDVQETFAIADYVYVMHQSKMIAEGTPAELWASEEPFIKRFIHGRHALDAGKVVV
ncbi:ABC transporter ATP-binding protein [Hydromonas duriensis]|uniref:Phospholipid/cholesterol/gamma-HCH transport system ATP-binding protein n=1 Tax=Hydromonas duriensis TaxID=1527608 RepID=A0A4R6Y3P0_9BURK|nr:ABC transporter ATP-binding protein [Hydromonas duriensis]TDR30980.1 phospholipid/cholesterol/gamma-HCH transport system ATP-binding protein [Hydromonas duriensis]